MHQDNHNGKEAPALQSPLLAERAQLHVKAAVMAQSIDGNKEKCGNKSIHKNDCCSLIRKPMVALSQGLLEKMK